MEFIMHIFSLLLLLMLNLLHLIAANQVGICYGTLGDNLPPASAVVALLRGRCNVTNVRVYDPHPDLMAALSEGGYRNRISVHLGVRNQDLPSLASDFAAAQAWVRQNFAPYTAAVQIPVVIVGNEVLPGEFAQYIVPAMRNLQRAFVGRRPPSLTTALSSGILSNTYPPSQSVFRPEVEGVMKDIVGFLLTTKNPQLYVHIYPYFAYAGDPVHVSLPYALFQSRSPVVVDGGRSYYNLFDAMLDAYAWALDKIGGARVRLVVAETGWPSAGNGNFTTPRLAGTYNRNLVNHIMRTRRTPKGAAMGGAFIFAMFNENQKSAGVEQNWGLFYPNMSPVYNTPLCH